MFGYGFPAWGLGRGWDGGRQRQQSDPFSDDIWPTGELWEALTPSSTSAPTRALQQPSQQPERAVTTRQTPTDITFPRNLLEFGSSFAPFALKADIFETEKEYKAIFDCPGVQKDDVQLWVEGDLLNIRVERKFPEKKLTGTGPLPSLTEDTASGTPTGTTTSMSSSSSSSSSMGAGAGGAGTGGGAGSGAGESQQPQIEWHFRERHYGKSQRTLRLPSTVDTSHMTAEMHNGQLEVTIPKRVDKGGGGRKSITIR